MLNFCILQIYFSTKFCSQVTADESIECSVLELTINPFKFAANYELLTDLTVSHLKEHSIFYRNM